MNDFKGIECRISIQKAENSVPDSLKTVRIQICAISNDFEEVLALSFIQRAKIFALSHLKIDFGCF